MISLLYLNKSLKFIIFTFFIFFISNYVFATEDIWKKDNDENKNVNEATSETEITIDNPLGSDEISKIVIKIDETEIEQSTEPVIGIFDPEENNFNLNMWSSSDGKDVLNVLKRIDKLKLSKLSEDLLFQVLFTNSYSPRKNLSSDNFLKLKINWLIKNNRIRDLEILLKNNQEVGKNPKVIKFLVDEYLSSAEIKSACEKINFIDKNLQDDYLDKFAIYCLVNNNQKEEAQLNLDLLKEREFKDAFFEDKINFLLGITDKTSQKILDNNLLNFYLSQITSNNFKYEPSDKTNKYIWKYLTAANLIKIDDVENEKVILTYEKAADQNIFDNQEIFKIYLQMNFNFNQLSNVEDIYKNLPNFKARALVYQSTMLADSPGKKIRFAFLLKDLFIKDKMFNLYEDELINILESIDPKEIPENYVKIIEQNMKKKDKTKIKFENDILHRSKVIRHFLDNGEKLSRTEKDFKSIYKKIKKNKKYFISIKDIIVLESLEADGIKLPDDLNYDSLSSNLTVPKNLTDLAKQNQIGLVMLKIVEIIGEDEIRDLDPETIYFLNKILNDLNLKKIRNNILSEALPVRT